MRTRSRVVRGAGITLVEIVLVVFVLAVVAALLLPRFARVRARPSRLHCRNNLRLIAQGMMVYLNEYGDNRWYPCPLGRGARRGDYSGAEWMASLYWTGVVPDPWVFICPNSGDDHEDGSQIGTHHAIPGRFGSQTVSYAGMHYYSNSDNPGAVEHNYPSNRPMASDDTQGDINHQGGDGAARGISVLFFDSHVEFLTSDELDPRRAVGDPSPDALLRELRN